MNEEETSQPEVALEDLDLHLIWRETTGLRYGEARWSTRNHFLDQVGALLTDPDDAEQVRFCALCCLPGVFDDGITVNYDSWVCGDPACRGTCATCSNCGDLFTFLTDTERETRVCDRCRDESYFYCEDCDEWCANDDRPEHEHSACACPVYGTEFSIRNGRGLLSSDTQVKVRLSAGVISDEGIGEISVYLRYDGLRFLDDPDLAAAISYGLPALGSNWQTKEGNYTKRLSRMAYKERQVKIPPEVLSRVGDIARSHSRAIDFEVAVTRELNQPASEFYHEDSCWWQSYAASLCALKSNGGFAMRTFDSDSNITGRAWVMPLRHEDHRFRPTFETVEPDAFVVFNGYGDLEGYSGARVLARMTGLTYRRVTFSCEPMYINAGGYLVAAEEIAHLYTDGGFGLAVNHHSDLYQAERVTTNV